MLGSGDRDPAAFLRVRIGPSFVLWCDTPTTMRQRLVCSVDKALTNHDPDSRPARQSRDDLITARFRHKDWGYARRALRLQNTLRRVDALQSSQHFCCRSKTPAG